MSIDEAITHCLEVADGQTAQGKCPECAMEHRQLAEWLRDYKRLKERESCENANGKKNHKSEVRRWKRRYLTLRQQTRWIPVSERLPEAGEYVGDVEKYYLVQNEYGDILVARYTHSEYWEQIYELRAVGDEIVAWMPLPAPYDPQESEVNNG